MIGKKYIKALRGENLPTKERIQHGGMEYGGTGRGEQPVARAVDSLRIDELLRLGLINEMHHIYGKQLITWHIAIHRRPSIWDEVRIPNRSTESAIVERITAVDMYNGTVTRLKSRSHEIIRGMCIDEITVRQMCRQQRIRNSHAGMYLVEAFEDLGDAIASMREYFDALENTHKALR